MANDLMNQPKYYVDQAVVLTPIVYCRLLPFDLGNAVKYVFRAGHKEGESEIKDLKKARDYMDDFYNQKTYLNLQAVRLFVELARPTFALSNNRVLIEAEAGVEQTDDAEDWFYRFFEMLQIAIFNRIRALEEEASRD